MSKRTMRHPGRLWTGRTGPASALAVSLVLLLAGCGSDGDSTGPSSNVASVTVTAPSSTLEALDATLQLQAAGLDGDGEPVDGVTFTWNSSAPGVGTVDGSGLVTAVSNGSASITASVDGASGSIAISVEQVATEMAFVVPPANNSVGEPFDQLQVEMRDANGNVTTNFEDAVTISIGTNPQGGSLSGQFTRDAAAGVVDFPGLALDAAGAGYTLVATRDGLSVESDPFNVTLPSAYVANSGTNTVSVIATASNTVVTNVTVGTGPRSLAISPDGLLVYVANSVSNTVSVIETPTNTVSSTITVGSQPEGVSFTPDGAFAYVTNRDDGSVSVIETATQTVTTTIPDVGTDPADIRITPDGASAYVGLFDTDSVVVISTANNTVTGRIQMGGIGPFKLGITPDGETVYAADLNNGRVYVIETATNTFVGTITTDAGAAFVAIDPSGSFGYVANSSASTISEIDVSTNTVTETFGAGGSTPAGVDFTPDGASAYVANFIAGSVSVFDTSNNMSTATIGVGPNPFALHVMPAPVP